MSKKALHVLAVLKDPRHANSREKALQGTYAVLGLEGARKHDLAATAWQVLSLHLEPAELGEMKFFVLDPSTGTVLLEREGSALDEPSQVIAGVRARVELLERKLPKLYEIVLMAEDTSREAFVVGHVALTAPSKRDARESAYEQLWDPRLNSAGCAPRYCLERLF